MDGVIHAGGPKVVVFTWATDHDSVVRALASGASGYLSRKLLPLDLVEAVEDIHAGAMITCDTDGTTLAQESGKDAVEAFDLSPREAEVLTLIATGLSNQEIARLIFLSVNSIKTYIRTAYLMIGVNSRTHAVLWALEHGFVAQTQGPGRTTRAS